MDGMASETGEGVFECWWPTWWPFEGSAVLLRGYGVSKAYSVTPRDSSSRLLNSCAFYWKFNHTFQIYLSSTHQKYCFVRGIRGPRSFLSFSNKLFKGFSFSYKQEAVYHRAHGKVKPLKVPGWFETQKSWTSGPFCGEMDFPWLFHRNVQNTSWGFQESSLPLQCCWIPWNTEDKLEMLQSCLLKDHLLLCIFNVFLSTKVEWSTKPLHRWGFISCQTFY